jgi:hypothetical protein
MSQPFYKLFQSRTGERDSTVGDVHLPVEGGRVCALRLGHLPSQQVETTTSSKYLLIVTVFWGAGGSRNPRFMAKLDKGFFLIKSSDSSFAVQNNGNPLSEEQ